MALPIRDATSVGVFGEDPIVGRALEQLLRSAGYAARFLNEASFEKAQALDGLKVLLFAGGADAERRETSMALLNRARADANLPMLELASALGGSGDGTPGVLPWPCRVEEMRARIDEVLRAEAGLGEGKASDD